jgi:hypothetical protein
MSSLKSAELVFLGTLVAFTSPTGHFISPLLVLRRKNYETSTDERHTAWINPRVPSLGVDTERDFFPVVSSFYQTQKADKTRSSYLSTERALFASQEPGGHYFSSRESCWHHCSHSSHITQPLDKALMWPLKTLYCQEIEKQLRSHPGRFVAVYQIDEILWNVYKRAEAREIAANGFRVTDLLPCDNNVFRP